MNEIFAIFSILAGSTMILAVIQHELNLSPVEFMDEKTGKTFRMTKIFGREIQACCK